MRKEALDWWKQAVEDLETAKVDLKNKKYYACSFWSQQAAEKALKALYLHTHKEPALGHSLIYFAKDAKAPREIFDACALLNPEYAVSRYPDAASGVPAEVHTESTSSTHLRKAVEVIAWVKQKLEL
ncbi:HEPN domain-containing protein [Candidatus Woesearchaeota archaeon]|nr:HEPN domain-containing protein [Candidatus Woesearchaeota archaeon]